jgi:phage tail protein X
MVANYNQLVQQQRTFTTAIEESLKAIEACLESKLQLAAQQKQLHAEIGIAYPDLAPADVRATVVAHVVSRLEQRAPTPLREWSMRRAQTGGNLEESV